MYQEPGGRNREEGTGRKEPGGRNREEGTGRKEPGGRNREEGRGPESGVSGKKGNHAVA
jgi:hypothetical protein